MRAIVAITSSLLLTGCVSIDVSTEDVLCSSGLRPATTAELFFGRNIGGRPGVSEDDWSRFVDEEVTPRFPEGLSVFDVQGQWRGEDGVTVRESSKVLMLILTDEEADREKLDAIREAYKARFRQEAVLLVERPACVGS
ncbi:MAG: DUF3574 domain-containing protein [Pseudomonadota bacterium]